MGAVSPPTTNPWDPGRIGRLQQWLGSCLGGRALPTRALGTDTAGSIRTLPPYCGIVGLKRGRASFPWRCVIPSPQLRRGGGRWA